MKKGIQFLFFLCSLSAYAQPTIWGGAKFATVQGDTSYFVSANGLATFIFEKDRAFGRATGQTAANTSVATLTVGAADASYMVSANLLLTTPGSAVITCRVQYTDETSTARTILLQFTEPVTAAVLNTLRFDRGPVFVSLPMHIRCKASTSITIDTTGGFTGCTYNVEGLIKKI